MAEKVVDVSGPDRDGKSTANAGRYGDITFARVKEPPVWRVGGDQQNYYANRWYWVKSDEHPRRVFIVQEKPEEGRYLDLSEAIELNEDAISY